MENQMWKIEGTNTGHVRIEIGGKTVLLPASDAGVMAAMLLNCARVAPSKVPEAGGHIDWIPVEPTTMTIGSSPLPENEALILGFGPALLGVSIKKRHLKPLGEAFLALSAEGPSQ